ncbi:LysM domain-containing protein [Colletotrichum truncatum]|uniref:LysM domain-containing protein n=1 Tax=Colletotrichum truncatum TaxID=5467 RepID=A0ACC3YTW9_COLTU|nr:LysM domain-containing protein [Colletotrichum truncatum]KAF6789736.1 LysM domain-containing protein [Colletotrichum truncatum]
MAAAQLWLWLRLWLWASLSLSPPAAHAQFIQNYRWVYDPVRDEDVPYWRPSPQVTQQPLYTLAPHVVVLEYNCAYMTAICQNANQYLQSPINQARRWQYMFAFDANTQRSSARGNRMCPTGINGWKSRHPCPEVAGVPAGNLAQPPIQRYDRGALPVPATNPWPHVDIQQPSLLPNGRRLFFVEDDVDPAGNVILSKLEYTCDEFPMRSTVEGGTGLPANVSPGNDPVEGRGQPGFTRCAASRWCSQPGAGGIASEQNWQARGQRMLHAALIATGQQVDSNYQANHLERPTIFHLRLANLGFNGVPATIYRGVPHLPQDVPMNSKRRRHLEALHRNTTAFLDWADKATTEQLLAGEGGHRVSRSHVMINGTDEELEPLQAAMSFPDLSLGLGSDFVGGDIEEPQPQKQQPRSEKPTDGYLNTAGGPRKLFSRAYLVARLNASGLLEEDAGTAPLLRNATQTDLNKAVALVEAAINESARRNEARYANPARNVYRLKPGTVPGGAGARLADPGSEGPPPPPPLLEITPELAAAAALVAEAEALQAELGTGNGTTPTRRRMRKRAGTFWMEHIARRGTVPLGDDPSYKVFRNVMDYGAKGDGVTDDTAAIQRAMDDGRRCGKGCNGSTVKNAIVYLPPGRYLVSRSIPVIFGTQLIGDAVDRPTIIASARFIGLGVLATDVYTGGGIGMDGLDQQWYVNTANFYRQIRNLRIDVTQTRSAQKVACLHYQIAQATSLQYVELIAKEGSQQRGIFAENGSGGMISDITFKGGEFGLYGGNQQFTAMRLKFDGCATGVHIIWDWGWIWKSITMTNIDVGFKLMRETGTGTAVTARSNRDKCQTGKNSVGNIGSASFIDSSFTNVNTVVLVGPIDPEPGKGSTGVVMENVQFSGVGRGVADSAGKVLLAGGSKHVEAWVTGPVYDAAGKREFSEGEDMARYRREVSLLDTSAGAGAPKSPYYERPKPQYEGRPASDFVHLKDFARGDGVADDTAGLQEALRRAGSGKILFVDAGTYLITGTVTVPSGAKIVGETWSQFAATGPYFGDANNPKVMLQIGSKGETGDVEMQDLLFTTIGPAAGAVLVEWNIKASSPGAAALWECHVRIGGALGTKLNPDECPPLTGGTNPPGCQAASLMMHITPQASGYFENMWLWVADHLIDDLDWNDANNTMPQVSVYVARGLLVESQAATWLYGTSSEHAVYYQYNLHHARNIFAGMIQTESPYFQPMPKAPAPFEGAVGRFAGDPDYSCAGDDFDGCDSSWALIMRGCQNIFIAGAGIYSWFDTYTQDCIGKHACQKALVLLDNNRANNRIQHLITIGAKYSVIIDGKGILALDNLNVESHPRWSQITWLDLQAGRGSHISPERATVIPLPHTTVPACSTFTLGRGAATDIPRLRREGAQNSDPGPGHDRCPACSFFRLVSSTCCGSGGSLCNPITIPANTPTPVDIELPAGFEPNQPFVDSEGVRRPADSPLPEQATIPRGTEFPSPFLIPGGQPLAGGEDGTGAGSENDIWVHPTIWDQPSPTVWCEPPCTIRLPPWTKATSTIDYPIVTVTDGTWTSKATRRPITVTEWVFEPMTITESRRPPGPTSTSSSSDDGGIIIVTWPKFDSTTTWPPITYTKDGSTRKTRPNPTNPTHPPPPPPPGPDPPPPPPRGEWPTPPIVISHGTPPRPTTTPCAFPAWQCPPPPGTHPDSPWGQDEPDDPDEEEEEEDGEEEICFADAQDPPDDPTSPNPQPPSSTTRAPTTTTRPPEKVWKRPDPQQNEKPYCYNGGEYTIRSLAVEAAREFCRETVPRVLTDGRIRGKKLVRKQHKIGGGQAILDLEVLHDDCEYIHDEGECYLYARVPIDSCDCSGVGWKRGGEVRNNCLRVRFDPQFLDENDEGCILCLDP